MTEMEQGEFTISQLFLIITQNDNWYDGYCTEVAARQLKSRHKRGQLSQQTYDDIFFHFGYKRHITYSK